MKKNIVILATGGTISGNASCETDMLTYKSAVLTVDSLIDSMPYIQNLAHVTGEEIAQIDSCDMNTEIWLKLANRINELLRSDKIDGVVVTHGTDTMEETAYFLNLVIKSEKPVVIVGAMRPANAISADGPMNLYNAVALASSQEASGRGVLVTLNDTINCSREVTKTNTALQDTFKSPDLGYLGYIQDGSSHFYRFPTRKHTTQTEFDITGLSELPQVEIIYSYVNSGLTLINSVVMAGVQGIVYAGLGNGGIPEFIKAELVKCARNGIVITRSSRTGSGIVTRNGAVDDDACGFVSADSLNPQKARVLLMLALTKTQNCTEIQRMFWEY
ncbi:type II asparaginase [Sporomusa malonica]|uniref:asparaginase n=1 Tax=Sporomusa malonica TaxID=112901 RepID=A0A1W1ZZ38_9FIRM|nr:type II asparaginase [Sporomusa malonica]SMC53328.1 L-asparaginase [Sporomusa malonica]